LAEHLCKICSGITRTAFTVKVLDKYDAPYIECKKCGFLFAEDPFWLNEAYSSAINISDTGLVSRNIYFTKIASAILYFFFDNKALYLDYAGGYGLFTRLMRDIGFNFYWQDPYCDNLFAKGFEYTPDRHDKPLLITAFEVFEHLADPEVINDMLSLSRNLLFSTELLPKELPSPKDWWYYSFEHGQHVAFYREKTLKHIAAKAGLNFYSFGGIHLFTEKKLNAAILKAVVKLSCYGLSWYVTKNMKSKTIEDHITMKLLEGKN